MSKAVSTHTSTLLTRRSLFAAGADVAASLPCAGFPAIAESASTVLASLKLDR